MAKPVAIMMIGPPGSGKSTWIDIFIADSSTVWIILSTDVIIEQYAIDNEMTYAEAFAVLSFKKVQAKFNVLLKQSINKQQNVIWDQTNMTSNSRRKKIVQFRSKYEIKAISFEIDRKELRRRAEKRKNETGKTVPEKVIDDMIDSYERPIKSEGFNHIQIIKS